MEEFIINYLSDCKALFVSSYSDRIKLHIRKFLKAKELGYLKDTSCFKFKECDVDNIDYLFERMQFDFVEDEEFVDCVPEDYPGYRDFYELFYKFYDKIKIEFPESENDKSYNLNIRL